MRPASEAALDALPIGPDASRLDVAAGRAGASPAAATVVGRYPAEATPIAGLMAAGPVVGAIHHAGEDAAVAATTAFLSPFRTSDGGYRITNVFRYAIGNPR